MIELLLVVILPAVILAFLTTGICYWFVRDEIKFQQIAKTIKDDEDLAP